MNKLQLRKLGVLLSEQRLLAEEEIKVDTASNVWSENKDKSAKFISSTVYSIRPIEGGSKFEVTVEKGKKREPFTTLTKQELDRSFAEIHPNQPGDDVESFVNYRNVTEVEAFQHAGDPVKLNTGELLNRGDFLIRKVEGDDFVYQVKKATEFERSFIKR
jgi:hypothetical protein